MNNDKFAKRSDMLLYFLKGSMGYFLAGIIFTCLLSFVELINPKVIGLTIDGMLDNDIWIKSNLKWIALFVIFVAFFGALFRYLFGIMNAKGAEILVKNMRDELYSHIVYLPSSWHGNNRTGDIIQRCTSDVDTIKRFLSEEMTTLLRTVVMIVFSLIFMISINPLLTIVPAVFVPVIIIYSLIFHKRVGSAFLKCDTEEGVLSAIAQENLTGVRVVRAFGQEKYERQRFMSQNESYTGLWVHMMNILSTFWASMDLLAGLQVLLVLTLGSLLCVKGKMTAGSFVSFVSYNAMLIWPVRELGRIIADMSKAGISVERIAYIMNSCPEEDEEGAGAFPENTDISFEHVSFSYDNADIYALKDINLEIREGTTVGILGKTGSGKSTLIKLLDGLYNCDEGVIKIGGTDIKYIKREELRRNIGLVLQEPYLFSRSLADNICIAAKDDKELENIVSIAQLETTVAKFSEGLNTMVGERGVTLSGGQKQRTAIAQAMIRKPPILIFDDSLSALDTKTDEALQKAIKEYTKDTTVILISHRITTLMRADRIFVMNDGRIEESGNHEELLKRGGLYKKIFDLQSGDSLYESEEKRRGGGFDEQG